MPQSPRFHRFRPRLIDSLRGYERRDLFNDVGAGITVAVVALPLAMAFAIASGLKPEQGLITSIVAGFLISALGGSNLQIGGPAGAFIVIVYGILQRYGLTNLLISTALAGMLMFALGFLKLGAWVRYIPITIVTGFTNGIAVLIALSQLKDLLGLVDRKDAGRLLRATRRAGNPSRQLQCRRVGAGPGDAGRPLPVAQAVDLEAVRQARSRNASRPATQAAWLRACPAR